MEKLTAEETALEITKVPHCMLMDTIPKLIKAYALQEIRKHLAIAAENAIIYLPSHTHLHGTDNVDKQSITGIKIELT